MSKILFSEEKCFGCGACISIAPNNFTFSDDGRTVMISDEVNEQSIEAGEICPARAISVEQTEVNESQCHCGGCDCEQPCDCTDECHCSDGCQCKN